jgi:RNA polymerase sigma factor (TIGR02999 family)
LLYDELRALARSTLGSMPPGGSVGATELVHEAFVRLVDAEQGTWENRRMFFFAAARAMRDILIERRRRKQSLKRGGAYARDDQELNELPAQETAEGLVALADALERMDGENGDHSRLIRMRFFEGLTNEETAQALGVSLSSVERAWRLVRLRLRRELA